MIKRIISLMKKGKWYFFLAVIGFCVLEMFTSILLPFCIKGITNGVVQYNIRKVIVSVSGYAGIFLMWWIISPYCQILLDNIAL